MFYWNVIGLSSGNGVLTSLSVSIKMSKHAKPVKTIAPTAMGQKSLGVPNIATGIMTTVIMIDQSQKWSEIVLRRFAKL